MYRRPVDRQIRKTALRHLNTHARNAYGAGMPKTCQNTYQTRPCEKQAPLSLKTSAQRCFMAPFPRTLKKDTPE